MSTFLDLKNQNFTFKKKYGQNFISDKNLLNAIVADAGITKDDVVLEIGAGAGTLTECISQKAKRVVSFEIDRELGPYLENKFQNTNVIIKIADIMKAEEDEIMKILGAAHYYIIANLPYYITTPIIMKFLEMKNPPASITIMVQKEVAERIVAEEGNSEYGAISISIALYGKAEIKRIVNRNMFMPVPNVDSAVLKIVYKKRDLKEVEFNKVKTLIRAAFSSRRKTFINNISSIGYNKTYIKSVLNELKYNENVRGEDLTVDDYIRISKVLTDRVN